MRSPFGIFRKHGTILTAGLVVLCMFAFTLADFLKPQHFPLILGMAAFGAIFYLLGQPSGKGGWYGLAGAVLGFIIVSMVPNAFGPPPAATTSIGELSEEELQKEMLERRRANEFIFKVYRVGAGERPTIPDLPPSIMNNPQFQGMIFQFFQRQRNWDNGFRNFGFASLDEGEEQARRNTVQTWVMAKQADEIGIRVSDRAITEYIQKASFGKLSREQFTEFRKELTMSEKELYDMLREQIKARQYLLLTFPSAITPPEQLWDFYTRATIQQDMEFVSVPVDAYTEEYLPFVASGETEYFADPKSTDNADGTLDDGTGVDVVLNPATDRPVTIVASGEDYVQIQSGEAAGAYVKSSSLALKPEVLEFVEPHKDRFPRGEILPQEGWRQPVEAMSPEPAFGVPRRIQLGYIKATIPEFEPTDDELKAYYESHTANYPNPSHSRPLDDDRIPEPLTPGGPAVAQKPKSLDGPAWADKREFLDFHHAQSDVKNDWVFEQQQKAREVIDDKINQLLAKMQELSVDWQTEGEGHKTRTEIDEELTEFAKELGFERGTDYVVTDYLTPKEMTQEPIGQAVEVDVKTNPAPGELKATVQTGGSNVVYQVFMNSRPEDLFQPNQAISANQVDLRYVYWKLDDKPPEPADRENLSFKQKAQVAEAWQIYKARDAAKARAEEIQESLAEYFSKEPAEDDAVDRDFTKALDDLKLENVNDGVKLNVGFAPLFRWLEFDNAQSRVKLGTVFGVEKAGEKFMETAFRELDYDPEAKVSDVGVLVNADATEFFVGRALNRRYGESTTLDGLRAAYLRETPGTPAMQVVAALEAQKSDELFRRWRQDFEEKFQIQLTSTEPAE